MRFLSTNRADRPERTSPAFRRWLFFGLTLAVIIGGFVYWQADLRADPPMYYAGIGQSLSTDPAQYTFHARNRILFDDWDPFDYPRWTVYRHSLISLVSFAWFSLTDVSLAESGRVGVLTLFAALILLLIGVARHHKPWVTTAIASCYILNVTLLTHGRVPYLENGLILLASATFLAYSWWGHRLRGIALCGVLAAAAMLTGKMFGALLLPALVLSVWTAGRTLRWRQVAVAVGSFVLGAIALALVLYGRDISAAFAYTGEQAFGLRGFPAGLSSPWAFFEHLVSYGFQNRLFYLNPELLGFLIIGGLLAVQFKSNDEGWSPATRFSLFWGIGALIGLMPLNYSPIRYTLLLIPAIIIFCFTMFDSTSQGRLREIGRRDRWPLIVLTGVIWLGLFHLAGNLLYFNTFPRPISAMVWITLPLAAGLGWLGLRILRRQKLEANRRAWLFALLVVLTAAGLSNTRHILRLYDREPNYTISEANADVNAILSAGSVVSGSYGPALTVETNLKSFIHLFQVAEVDPDLFVNNPITHIAVDISNFREAVANYPELTDLPPVTRYWIRDIEVGLFRVSDQFGNPEAATYQLSSFEQAVALFHRNQIDSALVSATDFYRAHPESKSAGLMLAELYLRKLRFDDVYAMLMEITDRFPSDFHIQLECGRFLQTLAFQQKDQGLYRLAQRYYERAVEVNPYRGQYAMDLWAAEARRFAPQSTPAAP